MAQMTDVSTSAPGELPWYKSLTGNQWRMLIAANLGWLFDGYETYALILTVGPAMHSLLEPSQYPQIPAYAGTVISITLLGWGIGGICGGILADYVGRRRTMIYAILAYSIMTGLTAFSFNWISFAVLRFLVGIAIGSEWATGTSMLAELWPQNARGKGAGLMQCGLGIGFFLASSDLAVRLRLRAGCLALHVRHRHPAGAAHGVDQKLDRGIAAVATGRRAAPRRQGAQGKPAPRSPRTTRRSPASPSPTCSSIR